MGGRGSKISSRITGGFKPKTPPRIIPQPGFPTIFSKPRIVKIGKQYHFSMKKGLTKGFKTKREAMSWLRRRRIMTAAQLGVAAGLYGYAGRQIWKTGMIQRAGVKILKKRIDRRARKNRSKFKIIQGG